MVTICIQHVLKGVTVNYEVHSFNYKIGHLGAVISVDLPKGHLKYIRCPRVSETLVMQNPVAGM